MTEPLTDSTTTDDSSSTLPSIIKRLAIHSGSLLTYLATHGIKWGLLTATFAWLFGLHIVAFFVWGALVGIVLEILDLHLHD